MSPGTARTRRTHPAGPRDAGAAGAASLLFLLFLADAAAHLVFRGLGADDPAWITKTLAMPILAASLLAAGLRTRMARWFAFGLLLSWVGDSLPWFFTGDTAFLTMVGGFLLAQLAYSTAFWPRRGRSILMRRRGYLLPYLLVLAAFLAACLPGAGVLAPAVVVYGVVLLATAILATGVNAIAALGGIVFIASDGMIALGAFADFWPLTSPVQDLAVMATYFAAQALLLFGVLAATRAGAPADPPALDR